MANNKKISLHKKQAEVFVNNKRFRVVVAGRRWGKTVLAKSVILKQATKSKQLIYYVAPTYKMARSIMWSILIENIPPKWIKKTNETYLTVELINGSKIELKGADRPDTLRGVGLDLVVLDEAQDISFETWTKVLRPTLSSSKNKGKALIIGTPKAYNWLYKVYMLGQAGDKVRNKEGEIVKNPWKSWQFPTITSPFISKEEIEAAKNELDEKVFRQEFMASFETMSGRVYHAFDRNIHVGNYPFNPRLPIWIGQDFNIDPMSSVIMQPQPNGELWIVDEVVLYSSNTQEVADEITRRYFKYQNSVIFYPDPAGGNRSHARGESDLDVLRDAGFTKIKYRKKHPSVSDRINAVNRMFQAADGTIRIKINRTCKSLIDSLEQTIYKPNSREVDKSAKMEHSADALGYCIDIEFPFKRFKPFGLSI